MAWVARNIYLAADDPAKVADALAPLLADAAHAADGEGLLDAPPPITITGALDGWLALIGVRGWVDSQHWVAAELARTLGTRAASCELLGHCFALRFESFDGAAALGMALHSPAESAGLMPLYEDVEQLAFERLRAEGVPAALAVVGTRAFGPADEMAPMLALSGGLRLSRDGAQLLREAAPLQTPDYLRGAAPVLPKSLGRDFGVMLFDERFVEGRVHAAGLDRLIALEAAWLDRARRADPASPRLSATVTYYSAAHQDALDAALGARGRHVLLRPPRDRPAWWEFWRYFGRVR